MRLLSALFSLLLVPSFVLAQDDPATLATQAAQQATEQAQQAAMQAMRDAQEANRRATEDLQQMMQTTQNSDTQPCCRYWTAPPKFSVKAGTYPGPVSVRITDATRGAVIYYTTDGWTPNINSARYRGPIVINSTTNLQAIAIAPFAVRSAVTSVQYSIEGSSATAPSSGEKAPSTPSFAAEAMNLPPGLLPVHLVFEAGVTSQTALVGDKIPMSLSEDLDLGDTVVKKGTPASATVTQVDRTAAGGAPGTLSFEMDDLQAPGGPLPLQGGATKEGAAKPPNAAILIPVVGPFTILKHGTDAVIAKGMPFTAFLDTQSPLAPAK